MFENFKLTKCRRVIILTHNFINFFWVNYGLQSQSGDAGCAGRTARYCTYRS